MYDYLILFIVFRNCLIYMCVCYIWCELPEHLVRMHGTFSVKFR